MKKIDKEDIENKGLKEIDKNVAKTIKKRMLTHKN